MIAAEERAKYADIWQLPQYGEHSPGEHWSDLFGEIANPKRGETCADFGCGMGAGGKALEANYGLDVTYVDLVNVGELDPFIQQPLWCPLPHLTVKGHSHYEHGYCCDVMEHLPEQFTMLAARNMIVTCKAVFFSISFGQDGFGAFIGKPLHLTVKPFTWWRDSLKEIGTVIEARDMLGQGVFYVAS